MASNLLLSDRNDRLDIVSFNMHGFNQGYVTINDLIDTYSPDVILLQEHWLTPANLSKFEIFSDYFMFGSSAMSKTVESGILHGQSTFWRSGYLNQECST